MTPAQLKEFEATLPPVPSPAGTYVDAVRTGNYLYRSKRVHVSGKVGRDFTKEEAYQFARQTGLILLGVIKKDLVRLRACGASSRSWAW